MEESFLIMRKTLQIFTACHVQLLGQSCWGRTGIFSQRVVTKWIFWQEDVFGSPPKAEQLN